MVTSPLVAFLLSPERLLELEWLWLDTPGLLTVLSTCRALRVEHQWRAVRAGVCLIEAFVVPCGAGWCVRRARELA